MNKTKIAVISGISTLSLLIVASGTFFVLHKGHGVNDFGAATTNVAAVSQKDGGSSSGDTRASSIAVGNDNIGQLVPQQSSGSNGSAQSTTGASASSNQGLPDPSTFAQYDKYKTATSAMFGEVQVGSGAELTAGKKAAVYYKGWLTNGTLFDGSRADSSGKVQPFVFELGGHQVIPGWEQGLAGMKVGGVRLVIVPPSVGYGDQAQASIPANSVLVFAVQLAEVQ